MKNAEIRDGKKQCRKCLEWIGIALFGTFLDKKKTKTKGTWIAERRYINSRCKNCSKETTKEWAIAHPEITKERQDRNNNRTRSNRDIIYNAYGDKCNCCGEENKLFLTIDHVNNDGYKIRPRNKNDNYCSPYSGHYYIQIIKANFPDDLQLLCWNCNCGKARNGGVCPHKNI